ncbi:hypothetical protein [Moritella viscosa]|uniref:hypothetical protein n=1 Tax=Moritella viscosa TaxID=80854 RepID=UPI0009178A2C|nr:hypothetical protein [Moritella viscosa]SGZ09402.1 Fructose-1,6-bisphosphatase class 1-D-fructose-1,6-bisphosphate 1-phosphohydrolase class 1 [Moritella viscosa]
MLLKWIFKKLGYEKVGLVGSAISMTAQKELDRLHEVMGLTAHKVDSCFSFNGYMKTKGNPEAAEIEKLLLKYSSCGYVFTKDDLLIGRICTITSKEERAKNRRSQFYVVDDSEQ